MGIDTAYTYSIEHSPGMFSEFFRNSYWFSRKTLVKIVFCLGVLQPGKPGKPGIIREFENGSGKPGNVREFENYSSKSGKIAISHM